MTGKKKSKDDDEQPAAEQERGDGPWQGEAEEEAAGPPNPNETAPAKPATDGEKKKNSDDR